MLIDWIDEPKRILGEFSKLEAMAEKIREDFSYIVLFGMGGSSLTVKMWQKIFARGSFDRFFCLDTIHPNAIEALQKKIDLKKTLFIVSSKSGSTLEPNILLDFFAKELKAAGVENIYDHFVAITDEGTSLSQKAQEKGFRHIVHGQAGIGGRFSAFSVFGIFPSLLLGIDAKRLLENALKAYEDCGPWVQIEENKAFILGAYLAAHAESGQNLLHLNLAAKFFALGQWLEQLIAESLGKKNSGLVPLMNSNFLKNQDNDVTNYVLQEKNSDNKNLEQAIKNDGSIFISEIEDEYELAQEMYRWEIAVCVAGILLKINPFDQPNVESSKKLSKEILQKIIASNFALPKEANFSTKNLEIYGAKIDESGEKIFKEFCEKFKENDYCAILSFLDENDETKTSLKNLAKTISKKNISVMVQHGPRYLHSTGQLFKGGINNGHYLILTGPYNSNIKSTKNIAISDIHYSQALGDFASLLKEDRHVVHVHLHDLTMGINELQSFLKVA